MSKVVINIVKIVVLLTEGTDLVQIFTDNPSPYVFQSHDSNLILEFKATYNTGIDYVIREFGIIPIVKNLRS